MGKYLKELKQQNDYKLLSIAYACGFPETSASKYVWNVNRNHPNGILVTICMLKGDFAGSTWTFLFEEFSISASFARSLRSTAKLSEGEYVFQMEQLCGKEYIAAYKKNKKQMAKEKQAEIGH